MRDEQLGSSFWALLLGHICKSIGHIAGDMGCALPVFCPAGAWKLFWVGTTSPCVCLETAQHTTGWWKRQDSLGLCLCLEWNSRRFPVSSITGSCLSVFISVSHQGLWFLWARQTPDKTVKLKPLRKSQMQNVICLKQQNPFP